MADISASALGAVVAANFFTTEVWTLRGLTTYYTLFVIELHSRRVHIVGSTPHPDEAFMIQIARHLTDATDGARVLICDRDRKWSTGVRHLLETSGCVSSRHRILSRAARDMDRKVSVEVVPRICSRSRLGGLKPTSSVSSSERRLKCEDESRDGTQSNGFGPALLTKPSPIYNPRSIAIGRTYPPVELEMSPSRPPGSSGQSWPPQPTARSLQTALVSFRSLLRRLIRHAGRFPALAVCLALLPGFASDAAARQFDSWTTESGLPQNSVNDILQTRDGYLWLATHGGLVRFDGVRFVVFDRSIPGIESQRIRALLEDRQGTLWAGTEDGMLIGYRQGRFITYTGQNGLPHDEAVRIEEDEEGNLWVTWRRGKITRFDGERFVNLGRAHFPHSVVPPPPERYLDLWWSQDASGVHALVNGRVLTFALDSELSGTDVTGVNADTRGNVWFWTDGAGVIKVGGGRLERYTTREGLPTNDPYGHFFEGSQGDIWFFDGHERRVYRIRNGTHELLNLSGFRSFHVDREGSTWFGTIAAGLHRHRDRAITVYTARDGVSLEGAHCLMEDSTGAIWIGGGLIRYAAGRFTSFTSARDTPLNRFVTSIYEDQSGTLWVGTVGGLVRLQNGRFRRFDDPSGFLTGAVRAMLEDRSGTFWFGTDTGLVSSTGGRFTRYTIEDGLAHNRISALFQERSGVLWIGSQQGLTRLQNGTFTRYAHHDGFIGNQVRAFHEDSEGVLWIGTYDGGLYRFADERLTRYTRKEGLHDNGIFQILEDDDGYFWMGSNRGIQRVSRVELNEFAAGRRRSIKAVVFDARDGLPTAEVNGGPQPSGFKRADGTLWFPTMGGIAVVDPTALQVNTPPPLAIIEEVRLAGRIVDRSRELRIPANVPAFDIRYTAPSFIKPEQVRFRYRLVGLDDDWIDAGDRRVASFYRIRAGKYRFLVTASSPYGVWNNEGQTLDIIILPPFWRTWWFIAIGCVALAFVAVAGHKHRVRRLHTEHAGQTAFSQRLIDSQESERRRISNELHDSLGQHVAIIKKRAQTAKEMADNQERAGAELDEIGMLAEQIRVEMKEIAQGLRPYHLDKIGLSKTIEKMVQRVGSACDLHVATDITRIDDVVPDGSQIHFYRIVQEALNNVIKHAKATHAKVTVARHSRSVQIMIEDNGHGFDAESVNRARLAGGGFGLMSMRERARILGGTVEIRSRSGEGTAIFLTFPLEGQAYE